ncbi:DUF4282 domain-containing protein [Marinicrinis lubricantis]
MSSEAASSFAIMPTLIVMIYGLFIGLGLYCLILIIRLARRGIQALDIYLEEKKNRRH